MTDTPETDDLEENIWATPYVDGQDFSLMVDHARKLERERNRLAEACKTLMKVVGEPNSLIDDCWASEDEIDEAWNISNEALQSLNQTNE